MLHSFFFIKARCKWRGWIYLWREIGCGNERFHQLSFWRGEAENAKFAKITNSLLYAK